MSTAFPVERLRAEFPALQRAGTGVFFDNAAGAQVPQAVFDAINEHLLERNVQRGGRYSQSVAVDETMHGHEPASPPWSMRAIRTRSPSA